MEEKEESEKIGEATLVSISHNKKVRCLEQGGIVSVIEKSRIELRNSKGDLIWDKVIIGEQYRKENVKIMGYHCLLGYAGGIKRERSLDWSFMSKFGK